MQRIWRGVYGADYPQAARPLGFSTLSEYRTLAAELDVGPGQRFIDLGCGCGGPGMWIAELTGASVLGVDVAPEAIAQAIASRSRFMLPPHRVGFRVAGMADTGLADESQDGALSVDALWMVDKRAAFAEARRILRPGARLVFTSWEPSHFSYAALLHEQGFQVVRCFEPIGWRENQRAVYAKILNHMDELRLELGARAAAVLIDEALSFGPALDDWRRVIVAARCPRGQA